MKFGKELRNTVENSLPEWRPMFMSYKTLKKSITPAHEGLLQRLVRHGADGDAGTGGERTAVAELNAAFLRGLKGEVDKVNAFFLDKQEDYVIRAAELSALVERLIASAAASPPTREAVLALKKDLVDFHGYLVLLDNFSHVNYTGFRKILKKHDKKTGLKLQRPYLSSVQVTPFLVCDTIPRLLSNTEAQLARLDTIRKYRRSAPAAPSFPPATPAPTPHPTACISPRSALFRVWAYASASPAAVTRQLVDAVDAVTPAELGIDAAFLAASTRPANHVIAATPHLAIGVLVLPPGSPPLDLLRRPHQGICVTRLLRGRARVALYASATPHSSSSSSGATVVRDSTPQRSQPSAGDASAGQSAGQDGAPREPDTVHVVETRAGNAVGPWPAISTLASDLGMRWTVSEDSAAAIFHVISPPILESRLPVYSLTPEQERLRDSANVDAGDRAGASTSGDAAPSLRATIDPSVSLDIAHSR